jgi:hypothetical protein
VKNYDGAKYYAKPKLQNKLTHVQKEANEQAKRSFAKKVMSQTKTLMLSGPLM